MAVNRHEAAFFTALWRSSLGSLLWPEGTAALVIGVGGGIALHHWVTVKDRVTIVGDSLVLVGALLGVVFAAFALLVALFSDEYVTLLDKAVGGIGAFLRPFILAIGLQVTTLLLSVTYVAIAKRVPPVAEFTLFLVWGFLFLYVLTDVVALTRNVLMHGLARAEQMKRKPSGDQTVRPLCDRSNP